MNNFSIKIENIQHIKSLEFSLDLKQGGLQAIIGKNGVGKTMLFKGIQNLITSNTFSKTSNRYIYKDDSSILYNIKIGSLDKEYKFIYDDKVKTLDYRGEIDDVILQNIYVELPIPFGERFSQFQKIGQADRAIRTNIVSQRYKEPNELIELLNYIYDTDRFNNLKEIEIKKEKFYVILLKDDYYIREDYLSSGEYFIINIYKLIQKKCQLIAIDEIDISLDAMAQVRFIEKLRNLSKENDIKLLFSTHSLALIKTLKDDELYYMKLDDGVCSFEKKSYNYIKSLLYGFKDYDKYILTEDEVLKSYIKYILQDEDIFSQYIILYIGGASNTVSLMDINKTKEIFDKEENVCTVLDGDMKKKAFCKNREDTYFMPFPNIEDELYKYFNDGSGFIDFKEEDLSKKYNLQGMIDSKKLYKMLIRENIKSQHEIFKFLTDKKKSEIDDFKKTLLKFLGN